NVQSVLSFYKDFIVWSDLIDLEQYFFDLRREYIDAADDKHVICPSGKIFDSCGHSSAFARLIENPGHISGPVTDNRKSLLSKTGHDKLSTLSRRQHFFCLRIDDFRYEPVFIY